MTEKGDDRAGRGSRSRLAVRLLAVALASLLLAGGRGVPATAGGGASGVTIDVPAEGALVGANVRVAGRVPILPAGRQAVLRINGADVAFKDGAFETTLEAPDGPLRIRAVFSEIGDPATVVERNAVVDATPPVLEIEQPAEEEGKFRTEEGVIQGVARDPHLEIVRMNDKAVAFDADGAFEVPFLLPKSAPLEVSIEAVDRVGNRSAVRRVLRHVEETLPPPTTAPPAAPLAGPVRAAVEEALRWLAAHQSADGGWSAEGFGRWCDGRAVERGDSDGAGRAQYDVGVTGLALLAFVRAGYTDRSEGRFGKVVSSALRYLRGVQDAEGCIGGRTSGHFVYNHAIAACAVVEAYRATRAPSLASPATRAVAFTVAARNPGMAWRYGVRPGDSDTSVTGWMATVLLEARTANEEGAKAGLPPAFALDDEAFAGVATWLQKMTDLDTGRVGYQQRGTGPARPTELIDAFPGDKSESMTAVAVLLRLRIGQDPKSRAIQLGANLCAQLAPAWRPDGSIDLYYWYYGTHALAAIGGAPWSEWRSRLLAALLPHQRRDADSCAFRGSWDPVDPWGADGGRVYTTAIAALSLEVANAVAGLPATDRPAPPAPSAKARLTALTDRASRWALLRQVCLDPCEQCNGRGALRGAVRCPRCNGAGKTFNSKLREAYLAMRSPAWRARPEALQEFQAFYKGIWGGQVPSPALRHYRLDAATFADDTHAVVPIFENGAALPTESRWIWASEPTFPKGTWYLYTESVDGPWP